MRALIYVLAIAIASFSVACKKKAADVNPDYVGYWTVSGSYEGSSLVIQSNSKAVYETNSGAVTKTVRGKARIQGNTLKIVTKKFTIDQEPKIDSAGYFIQYTMILDGVTYVKH
ncbi:hypothetical protein D3C87_84820 [compost metagenome]